MQDGCSWLRTVLQYSLLYCRRRLGRLELYRNTLRCIAIVEQRQGWTVLRYSAQPSHDTARRRTGSRRWGALSAQGAQVGPGQALGAQGEPGARRLALGAGRAGAGRAGGAQAHGAHGAGGSRRAGGTAGAWQGRAGWPGLCTWCTWPVFGSIRLSIFPE